MELYQRVKNLRGAHVTVIHVDVHFYLLADINKCLRAECKTSLNNYDVNSAGWGRRKINDFNRFRAGTGTFLRLETGAFTGMYGTFVHVRTKYVQHAYNFIDVFYYITNQTQNIFLGSFKLCLSRIILLIEFKLKK